VKPGDKVGLTESFRSTLTDEEKRRLVDLRVVDIRGGMALLTNGEHIGLTKVVCSERNLRERK